MSKSAVGPWPEERTYGVEVAHGQESVAAGLGDEWRAQDGIEDAVADPLLERRADTRQHAAADQLEDALCDEQANGEQRQGHQRRHALTWQDAVIDLKHEERAGQHQYVADTAEQTHAKEGRRAGSDRRSQFGFPRGGRHSQPPRAGGARL